MKKFIYFLPAVVYYALIFYLSSSDIGIPINVRHFDKAAHFAEYGILGFLLALGFFNALSSSRSVKVGLSLFVSLALAGLDEFHQFFVPWRAVEVLDLLADAAGATAGVLAFLFLFQREKLFRRPAKAKTS